MTDYVNARQAATELGISYREMIDRLQKNEIASERWGWSYMIHKDELARYKAVQK